MIDNAVLDRFAGSDRHFEDAFDRFVVFLFMERLSGMVSLIIVIKFNYFTLCTCTIV